MHCETKKYERVKGLNIRCVGEENLRRSGDILHHDMPILYDALKYDCNKGKR